MSYTQFVATASLSVVDNFNLKSYLDAISTRSVTEENFLLEEYGEVDGKIDLDFDSYVHQVGDRILIECDTEEYNNNAEVWDWLIDQFIPVMTSQFVEVKSATVDSRAGVDIDFTLYGKDHQVVQLSDLVGNYLCSLAVQ